MTEPNRVLEFLKEHVSEAFFLPELSEALDEKGVKPKDLLEVCRECEQHGIVLLETTWPYGEGYIVTSIDRDKSKEEAIKEAKARIDSKRGRLETGAKKTIREITPFLEGKRLVLDLGCGGGRLAVPLVEGGKTVVGLDLSLQSLRRAREWADERGVDLKAVLGRAEALPFKCCFDGLICSFMLEFASDPLKAIGELHDALRHDGRMVVTLLPAIDDHVRGSSYKRFTGQRPITNSLLPWEAIALLGVAGFRIVHKEVQSPPSLPSEVKNWLEKNSRIAMCMSSAQIYCEKSDTNKARRQVTTLSDI